MYARGVVMVTTIINNWGVGQICENVTRKEVRLESLSGLATTEEAVKIAMRWPWKGKPFHLPGVLHADDKDAGSQGRCTKVTSFEHRPLCYITADISTLEKFGKPLFKLAR